MTSPLLSSLTSSRYETWRSELVRPEDIHIQLGLTVCLSLFVYVLFFSPVFLSLQRRQKREADEGDDSDTRRAK